MKTEVGFVRLAGPDWTVTERLRLTIEPQTLAEATLLEIFSKRTGIPLAKDGIGTLVIEEPEK